MNGSASATAPRAHRDRRSRPSRLLAPAPHRPELEERAGSTANVTLVDAHTVVALLADTASSVTRFVQICFGVYILMLLIHVLWSMVASLMQLPYSPTLSKVQGFLYDICDPYLRLFRRFIPPLGAFDLSPIVAIFVLVLVQQLVTALLESVL